MDTGNPSSSNSHPYFKFELGWLLREGFMDMVKEIWASVQMGNTPLEDGTLKLAILLCLVWMRMYSSQFTCVEVDWSRIELSSIPFHSNTCGLKWIYMHPNKALRGWAKNTSGAYKKEKKALLDKLDDLDKKKQNTYISMKKK